MTGRSFRMVLFFSMVLSLISFWDHPVMSYTKEFVVLIHEICHAIAALLTGGGVQNIVIHGNESGETIATVSGVQGSFLFIVSAGYLGTALIGSILLYKGLTGSNQKSTLILFGILVFFITMKYSAAGEFAYNVGVVSSLLILVSGFLGRRVGAFALVFLGATISLYSIYDLSDFTRNVQHTDAGILAFYLTGYDPNLSKTIPPSVQILGYLIAITWSLISIGTIYSFLSRSLVSDEGMVTPGTDPMPPSENPMEGPAEFFPGELTPEVVDWFLARGLDLNGRPLNRELVDEFSKDSEMS